MKRARNHLSIKHCLFLVIITAIGFILNSCDSDDTPDVPETVKQTSGFVIVGQTASLTALAKYIEELPIGGTVDLTTDVTDFQQFFPRTVFNSDIYFASPDGLGGFSKFIVDQNGEFLEVGRISTFAQNSFQMDILDDQRGVFHDRSTPRQITVFNPTTFEITNTIDMSAGFVPGGVDQRYNKFIFRGNDVFGIIRGNDGTHFPSFIVHQANLNTNSFVGDTRREGNGVSAIQTTNFFGQRVTDAMGNVYFQDAGNFEGAGIPAAINVIRPGSNEFDSTYNFFPAVVLNPSNVFLPSVTNFTIIEGTTRGIANVNAETPQEAIDIVTQAGGIANLTDAQINEILDILFQAESAGWCELDMMAQTVTPIAGIPPIGPLTGGTIFRHNGDIFLPVITETENAYYSYNPVTGVASKAFDVIGADLTGAYNLAENN